MEVISLEQAKQYIYKYTKSVHTEKVSVYDAVDRHLAEDVEAAINQPPFRRSAMDGYAIRSQDVKGASEGIPAELSVIYKAHAGNAPGRELKPLEAVRIMTGAVVPDGADCVVQQERTDYGEEKVLVYCEARPDDNCCPVGEDFKRGDKLLKRGDKLDCYGCAVAASAGSNELLVYRRPKVLLLTTGDELCEPGETLLPGKIYDSNAVYLLTRLKQLGCEVTGILRTGDDIEKICAGIEENREKVDLILTTGGVSVGQKDFLPAAVERLNGTCLFHGIQLKPGMPTMFSVIGDTPVLSLSGNPYSAIAVFELLMQPFLQKSRGGECLEYRRKATAVGVFPKSSPARRMIKGRLCGTEVYIEKEQGNGQLKSGIGTNCMVDIPPGRGPICTGDEVEVILITKE